MVAENTMRTTGEYDINERSDGDKQTEHRSNLKFEFFCFMPQYIHAETCTDSTTEQCEKNQGALTDAPFVFDGASFIEGK